MSHPLVPAWYLACESGPPYDYHPCHFKPVNPMSSRGKTEVEFQGRRIVATKYTGAFDKSDTMGFDVPVAFVVLDEFDEPALPIVQHWFWSPWDARNAIKMVDWLKDRIERDKRLWPSTVPYEFNLMLAYRRNFADVYATLREIEDMCISARDFDENVTESVLRKVQHLRQLAAEGGDY